MGVQRVVTFPAGEPTWPAVAAKLAEAGERPPVRMIDGLPAFPDEEDWGLSLVRSATAPR